MTYVWIAAFILYWALGVLGWIAFWTNDLDMTLLAFLAGLLFFWVAAPVWWLITHFERHETREIVVIKQRRQR